MKLWLYSRPRGYNRGGFVFTHILPTITSSSWHNNIFICMKKILQVGNLVNDKNRKFKNPQVGRVYLDSGISPTLTTLQGGNREPKIIVSNEWKTVIGSNQANAFKGEIDGVSPCITSACGMGPILSEQTLSDVSAPDFPENVRNYKIRKLTPRECFRLMDVSDADIDKIQTSGISDTQQYKMAGNSIVVANLYHIFRKMFCDRENENEQLTLF